MPCVTFGIGFFHLAQVLWDSSQRKYTLIIETCPKKWSTSTGSDGLPPGTGHNGQCPSAAPPTCAMPHSFPPVPGEDLAWSQRQGVLITPWPKAGSSCAEHGSGAGCIRGLAKAAQLQTPLFPTADSHHGSLAQTRLPHRLCRTNCSSARLLRHSLEGRPANACEVLSLSSGANNRGSLRS